MTEKIFILLAVFFLIGGAGVWRIIFKKPEEKKRLLVKYSTYIIIVFGVCSLFAFSNWKLWFSYFLAAAGLSEIIYSWFRSDKRKALVLLTGIITFTLISFAFLTGIKSLDTIFLLQLYVIVLSFDGFSQVSGQLFGRKKITPKVSPNKTLGGVIGGSVIAIATGIFLFYGGEKNIVQSFFISLLIVVSSFTGDLLASYYKRKCGIKDYSNLLPGHGGILDRFDSFIFAVAVMGLRLLLLA